MTTLRTAAQQALAFTMRDFASLRDFEAAKAVLHDNLRAALAQQAEPVQEPPLGKASTDVGVPVYVLKKAEPPCNPSCAPGYCYCDGIKEGT